MCEQTAEQNPEKLSENILNAFVKYQSALTTLASNMNIKDRVENVDPLNVAESLTKALSEIITNPEKLWDNAFYAYGEYFSLWNDFMERLTGNDQAAKPQSKDNRFNDSSWNENPFFGFMRDFYLTNQRLSTHFFQNLSSIDSKEKRKLRFFSNQVWDAVSPSNFLLTNPKVLKETIESNGENLVRGADLFLEDVKKSKNGNFKISTTDSEAFELGRNLAITPGKVVYQNDLIQLIQYEPSTDKVKEIPLLMVPAWINKYYILDLQPSNSFVKWVVDQGYTVFMISWRNPDANLKDKSFDSYMIEGTLAAINKVRELCKVEQINALGYCLGGTLLAATLAYLKAKKQNYVKGATFLTSLVDFEESGDLCVFIDEKQISYLEQKMKEDGYLDGHEMAQTFSALRANDMIWSFFVNNYLLGKDPFPFDILYWNADSTRLPAKMHSYYLRNMYQNNLLSKPNALSLADTPIDLRKIDNPVYILSTKEDHITPWQSTYKATKIYSGDTRFVLSASGHVAGVVNHPSKNKYSHWTNENIKLDAESWFEKADSKAGSWWLDWINWIGGYSASSIPSQERKIGKFVEPAPGSYVMTKV